jgi:hypothetical protein
MSVSGAAPAMRVKERRGMQGLERRETGFRERVDLR